MTKTVPTPLRRLAAAVAAAGLVAACSVLDPAPPPTLEGWENPDLPRDQWAAQADACRREATRKAEYEYRGEQVYLNRGDTAGRDAYAASMSQWDLRRQKAELFAACLRSLGFVRRGEGGGANADGARSLLPPASAATPLGGTRPSR